MHPSDIFHRLPPSTTLFLLSTLFHSTNAHALPRQTKTISYHELDVLPFPIPTADLFPRQQQHNTICGYIGGDPDLPATCSSGSHCAVDVEHGAIGCCPDGGACTAGVYTGCVDRNSDPQTEVNPYVFSCGGGDVCYQNVFDGGYFQYGCGSSSGQAATVAATASGKDALSLTKLSVEMTAEPTTLSEPTTLGTGTSSEPDSSSTDSSSTESSSTESTETESAETQSTRTEESSTERPSATETDDAADAEAPSSNDNDSENIGAIVGGTIGGIAFVAALLVLALYLWRRKKGNTRHGPGVNQDTQYISPMEDGRHPFAPLPSVREVDESQLPQEMPRAAGANTSFGGVSSESYNDDQEFFNRSVSPYRSSSSTNGGRAVGGSGLQEHDHMPLTSDHMHGGHHQPVPVADEFMRPNYGDSAAEHQMGDAYEAYPGPRRRDHGGALWQQNRRQSHNMVWM